jgi:hypothetical protein
MTRGIQKELFYFMKNRFHKPPGRTLHNDTMEDGFENQKWKI